MRRPRQCAAEQIEPLEAERLRSKGLKYAVEHTSHSSSVYRIDARQEDGTLDTVELVAFGKTDRVGIAWQGREWWLDASSPRDALQRWLGGEGRASASRRRSQSD